MKKYTKPEIVIAFLEANDIIAVSSINNKFDLKSLGALEIDKF